MLVQFMVEEHGVSRADQYRPKTKNDTPVINALQELIAKHPSIGFWQCYFRLRRRGVEWNHKKVYRVYTGSQA